MSLAHIKAMTDNELLQSLANAGSVSEMAITHGVARTTLRDFLKTRGVSLSSALLSVGGTPTYVGSATTLSSPIVSLDELLKQAEVDPEKWTVVEPSLNAWTMPSPDGPVQMYQVKAKLRSTQKMLAEEDFRQGLMKDLASVVSGRPAIRSSLVDETEDLGRLVPVVGLYDFHLGMYADGVETGGADWNMGRAIATWNQATNEALYLLKNRYQHMKIREIVVPMGNDYFHFDQYEKGKVPTTTAGTPQDTSARLHRMYRVGLQLARDFINELAEIAPVRVIIVPGNHDQYLSWFLGEALQVVAFPAHVVIDNDPVLRKYYHNDELLLGFIHGKAPKAKLSELPLIMAQDQPKAWGSTSCREWHRGHLHGQSVEDIGGVLVRVMPSLVPPDAWHAANLYLHRRRTTQLLWYHVYSGFIGLDEIAARN
jgi:hypothetical protein